MGLAGAVADVLRDALPGLFGGDAPAVTLAVDRADLVVERVPGGAAEAEPRRADGSDVLPFDGAGPYTLSRSPASGPRQVRLDGDRGRVAVRADEIRWDTEDPRRFTLDLGDRDVTGITAVLAQYPVTAVRTRTSVRQTIHIGLSGADTATLERAEALVLAVLALEGRRIASAGGDEHTDADHTATVRTESLDVAGSSAAEDGGRVLAVRARQEIPAERVPRADEGVPITSIHGPGERPARPVDIPVAVQA